MNARGALVSAAGAVVATIASCASTAAQLPLPEASAVGRVVVSWPTADGAEREVVIEDPKRVERLLAFLRGHNDGWRKPWDTFPGPDFTVSLKRDKVLEILGVPKD